MIEQIKRYKWWLFALILLGSVVAFFERWRDHRDHSQDAVIFAAAARYGLDPALVKAVVWRESRFNPRAHGTKGEIGLMQIRNTAAQEWAKAERVLLFTHQQLYDPAKNTLAGTWYLKKLRARYPQTDDPLPYALADYNAGRTKVLQWSNGVTITNSAAFINQIGYPMTQDYVRSVMKRYEHYRAIFPPKRD